MDHFNRDDWRAEADRNQSTVKVMKISHAELDVGSDSSMLLGNNSRLVCPIRQEDFFPIKCIKSHFQFVCVNKGIVGVRYLPCFFQKCYTREIYHRPKLDCILHLARAYVLPRTNKFIQQIFL